MDKDPKYYEYVVVGCGGIGSGTLYWLSKEAHNGVLGLEQFQLGHDHGGSQDHSRIMRYLYAEEMYTKLTKYTFEAWEAVERESGLQLVHKCGTLDMARRGTSGYEILNKNAEASDRQGITFKRWNAIQIMDRFPQFHLSPDTEGLFKVEVGLVDAALANSVHIQLARAHGAEVLERCVVTRLEPLNGDHCVVHTNKGNFRCRRVIVTAGAWINQVLSSVNIEIPVTVTQEQVTYIATSNVKEFIKERFPAFSYYTLNGFSLYGMPSHVNPFFKIGLDSTGDAVLPGTRNYRPDKIRENYCKEWCRRFLPQADGPIAYTKTCLYTMTPDRNFVIDTLAHKGMPQIIICCGAGHAYKFASLLGKILTELAVKGTTHYDIESFTMQREAIQNRILKPVFWRGDMNVAKL